MSTQGGARLALSRSSSAEETKRVARLKSYVRVARRGDAVRALLPKLQDATTLQDICTPPPHVTARPEERVMDALAGHSKRWIPVLENDRIVGMLVREDGMEEDADTLVRDAMDDPWRYRVPRTTSVFDVLARFESGHPLLVTHRGRLEGIVTFADLNRRAFRVALYALVAELEGRLAEALRERHPAVDEFLGAVKGKLRSSHLSRWRKERHAGVMTHPVEALNLCDLAKLVASEPDLAPIRSGMESEAWLEAMAGIVTLRNAVMHPVRPLVRDPDDVRILRERLGLLERAWQRSLRLQGDREASDGRWDHPLLRVAGPRRLAVPVDEDGGIPLRLGLHERTGR